jgi:hypothetical protein
MPKRHAFLMHEQVAASSRDEAEQLATELVATASTIARCTNPRTIINPSRPRIFLSFKKPIKKGLPGAPCNAEPQSSLRLLKFQRSSHHDKHTKQHEQPSPLNEVKLITFSAMVNPFGSAFCKIKMLAMVINFTRHKNTANTTKISHLK